MKKYGSLFLTSILSFSMAVPSYSLHADKPFTEDVRNEAAEYLAGLPADAMQKFLNGEYLFSEYEASVSESYVSSFLNETAQVPMFKDFDFERYAAIAPQILFMPRASMGSTMGYAYKGKILVNFGLNRESTDDYKQSVTHEMLHLGTNGLAMEWLDEAFAVLGTQRADEAAGREAHIFNDNATARNDLKIGALIARLVGGEDKFAQMAGEENAYELISRSFDAAQGYISFDDFSFANVSIRADNDVDGVNYDLNLKYLEHIVNNPRPSEKDETLAEIRGFYTLPSKDTATEISESLSGYVNGYLSSAECMDRLTRRVFTNAPDNIFYSDGSDAVIAMEDNALQIAYALAIPAPVNNPGSELFAGETDEPAMFFVWADAFTALKLTRFADENDFSSSARNVMDNATLYALVGKLAEAAFTPESIVNLNSFPDCAETAYTEMGKVFAARTGKEFSTLFAREKSVMAPDTMLKEVITQCFVTPVKDGVLDSRTAAHELNGFRESNYELLSGRRLLGMVDEAVAEISAAN